MSADCRYPDNVRERLLEGNSEHDTVLESNDSSMTNGLARMSSILYGPISPRYTDSNCYEHAYANMNASWAVLATVQANGVE